jgi:hypothetical protein
MAEFHKIPVDLFNNIFDYIGTGDPTSTLPNAATGSLYRKLDGVSGSTLWQKTSSAWEALQGSSWNQTTADGRYVQLAGSTMNSAARLIFPTLTTNSQLAVGTIETQGYQLNNAWIGENIYYDGSNFRYRATGFAAQVYFVAGAIEFRIYASGTAGVAIGAVTAYQFNPGTALFNNQGTITLGSPSTYAIQIAAASSVKMSIGVDGTRAYIQSWGLQPLFLNNQGNPVQVGSYFAVGSNYAGGSRNDGDIVSRRSATTGVYYFGDSTGTYLYFDGTNFNFSSASGTAYVYSPGGFYHPGKFDTTPSGAINATAVLTIAGQVTGYSLTLSDSYGTAPFLIREKGLLGAGSGTVNEAPRMTWHWSGRDAAQIAFYSDGTFRFWGTDSTSYRSIYVNSVVTDGYTYVNGTIFGSGYGKGLVGAYDPGKWRLIYGMGASWLPDVNGVNIGTAGGNGVYGLFFVYDDTGGTGKNISGHTMGHGICIISNNTVTSLMANGFWTVGNSYAADFILNSDRNLKDNLVPIESALDKVERLTGYLFNYKADPTRRRAGVVAQEVNEVLPEAVISGETLGVSYDSLVPLLIEAVKELKAEVRNGMETN